MKLNLITSTLIFSALLAGFPACQKQNESEVHDTVVIRTKMKKAAVGGVESHLTIDATCDWSMEGEDWFTIEPDHGTKGESETTITVQPNATGADRTGTIKLKAGTYSGTYTFTQSGK